MNSRTMAIVFALCLGSLGALVWAGVWGQERSDARGPAKSTTAHEETAHAHQSLRGGQIKVVGDHHVEALLQKGGRLCVYVLGREEAELTPIPASALAAEIQSGDDLEFLPLQLQARPQPGEPAGHASSFVAVLPTEMVRRPLSLTLTVPLGEKRYRVRFDLKESAHGEKAHGKGEEGHAGVPEMPQGVGTGAERRQGGGSAAERHLYQTPGGLYRPADIQANGLQPPSVKFKGVFASHDMNPKAGDPLCPITNTRANPKFAWRVNGKQYLFCCPPCIDEFVRKAKQQPETVRPPEAYVKR